jgi:glycine C-acetyltransferase
MSKSLEKGLTDFVNPIGKSLISRNEAFVEWVDNASKEGYFQFLRHHEERQNIETTVFGWGGQKYKGINLASQDYLGLSTNEKVILASSRNLNSLGTHSAGSEPMGGGFGTAKLLEKKIGEYISYDNVVLFPTGWAAGYGGIRGIIRPHDYIVMDALAHNCLQHGAYASTPNVSLFLHNDMESLEKRLERIRKNSPDSAILIVTESLFSMDSDFPDFDKLFKLAEKYEAFTLIDVAHDLGILGDSGKGVIFDSKHYRKADFIIGSFSKTFASIGGFFASKDKGSSYYVRGFSGSYTFSNYLIPAQVGAVLQSFEIISSSEGNSLRERTLTNSKYLRNKLEQLGFNCLGVISPMVIALIGEEKIARRAYKYCLENGLVLNNIEYPACRKGEARFRMQVTPNHTFDQLEKAAEILKKAMDFVTQ